MSISEGLDGRHIDVIASNEADGKEELNQLEVPLISNGSMLLERSKSKSDGNIGEESKFGPSNQGQLVGMISRSVARSIESEVHQKDVVSRRKKKLTEKMRRFQLDELERKQSNLHRKMTRKTNTVEDLLYSFKNTEAVREQLHQFDDIFRMMLDVQKSYNSLLPPAKQQRDEESFDDLNHNVCSFKQSVHSWIKDAAAERQAQFSSKQSVSTKASSQSRSSRRSSSKASSRASREKRAFEERIKMAELIAEAEYMEKKKSLESENLRIQLAAEVAKSKARVKISETPSEVPDDAQATLKSETSYLDQLQDGKEVKGKSQKESEPNSMLRKRERCDANFEQGKVHVRYHRDKIGMSPDADRVSYNERLYLKSYRNTWDPDEDGKPVCLARGCILLKGKTSMKPHLMHYVSFFNCRQLQRWIWNSLMAIL